MEQQYKRQRLHNAHEWRRFFLLWLTVLVWTLFLGYMVLFHYHRDFFEPLLMSHFGVTSPIYYQFAEIKLFLYLLWSCSIISVLSIINTWNKKRRKGDNIPDRYLIVMMVSCVCFAFYYVKTDLNYLNGQLSILEGLFAY